MSHESRSEARRTGPLSRMYEPDVPIGWDVGNGHIPHSGGGIC